MAAVDIVYWEEKAWFLGYLRDYPEYWTQGKTLNDLEEHLRDIYRDICDGHVPGVRPDRGDKVQRPTITRESSDG